MSKGVIEEAQYVTCWTPNCTASECMTYDNMDRAHAEDELPEREWGRDPDTGYWLCPDCFELYRQAHGEDPNDMMDRCEECGVMVACNHTLCDHCEMQEAFSGE